MEKNILVYKRMSICSLFFKRLFDILLSFLAIIVFSPLLLIISLIVKFTSNGPVLFKDNRIGKNGKNIKVLKFRSMYVDAETRIKEYLTEEEYNRWLVERKLDNDPRITKIGNILRKTSLDELPQLFNILKGDMSIVGPRPITKLELEENFTEEERQILLSTRPGLTGYWQVYGRSNVDYKSGLRQKLELAYFKHIGVFFDLKIIFLTIPAVLLKKGAK